MTLLTTLYKTLIVIAIASFFIFFYTFKIKERTAHLEGAKSELEEEGNGELERKNSELIAENHQLEEQKQEILVKENSELKKEKPSLEEKMQELKNKSSELKLKDTQLEQRVQELEEKIQELEEKNAKLNEEKLGVKENNNSDVEKEFCKPKTNILFLKTHKTASTTVMNLFHRFADKNQLTVAIKVNPPKIKKFNRCSIYPLKPGNEYNIFTHHTMFNYEEMKDIMPKDTTFLTILRDPVAQFESTYGYFSLEDVYGMNISAFADLDMSHPKWSRIKNRRRKGKNGRNPNCYDLGIDPEFFDDEEAILRKVQELDQQFDLVMITELFNESMILMKEKLCWDDLSDVTGIKSNVRSADVKLHLSSEQKMKLREKNRADQILYDYFYEKFLRHIDAFGKEKMEKKMEKLRALTKKINEVCVEYTNVGSFNNPKGKMMTKFRAGAQKHKVCRDILNEKKNGGWRKWSESKFEKAIKCED